MAGHVLRLDLPIAFRRNCLFLIGAGLLAAGLLWNIWLPINKKLWTDSFATFMAGLDFVFVAALIWVVDERHFSKFLKPFVITGMNAIVVYVASEFLSEFLDATSLHEVIYNKFFVPLASPVNASLLWAVAFTAPHVPHQLCHVSARLVCSYLIFSYPVPRFSYFQACSMSCSR